MPQRSVFPPRQPAGDGRWDAPVVDSVGVAFIICRPGPLRLF
jgi:predicted mannosyl-3-phosphoglycerate phosphatase (HAD superfamily)